jgi:Spy/CpxP family protein refolding chaperone
MTLQTRHARHAAMAAAAISLTLIGAIVVNAVVHAQVIRRYAVVLTSLASVVVHAAEQDPGVRHASFIAQQGGPGGPGGRGPGRGGPMGRGGPGGPGAMLDLPLPRLGLSAQQQDQVRAILDSHQAEMTALRDRSEAARDGLQAAITADVVDDNAIRARSADLAAVDADMAVARAHVRAEVLQILTADQRAQAKQMEAERPAGRGR